VPNSYVRVYLGSKQTKAGSVPFHKTGVQPFAVFPIWEETSVSIDLRPIKYKLFSAFYDYKVRSKEMKKAKATGIVDAALHAFESHEEIITATRLRSLPVLRVEIWCNLKAALGTLKKPPFPPEVAMAGKTEEEYKYMMQQGDIDSQMNKEKKSGGVGGMFSSLLSAIATATGLKAKRIDIPNVVLNDDGEQEVYLGTFFS
jgi:hypothetical protein